MMQLNSHSTETVLQATETSKSIASCTANNCDWEALSPLSTHLQITCGDLNLKFSKPYKCAHKVLNKQQVGLKFKTTS